MQVIANNWFKTGVKPIAKVNVEAQSAIDPKFESVIVSA